MRSFAGRLTSRDNRGEGDRHRTRDVTPFALGIAALLHAALLALTPLFPARQSPLSFRDTTRGDSFDIDVELPKNPAEPTPNEPPKEVPTAPPNAIDAPKPLQTRGPTREPESTRLSAPRGAKTSVVNPVELPGPSTGEPPPGSPGGESPPSDTFSPIEGPTPLTGLGSSPVWAIPGVLAPAAGPAPAPTTAPAARPTDTNIAGQVLSGSLQKKDHSLGIDFPAGGVVASTIADTVRASEAPPDARATFEVRLGPTGDVLGVRVVSSSAGNAATWERVAKGAGSALRGRGLVMNGDAASKGATVTVKVESKLVYPAGTKEKIDAQPVCANEVIEDLLDEIAGTAGNDSGRGPIKDPAVNRTDPSKENPDPGAEERRLRFCIPIGIKGKGDLSNIGAHMQTVVRSTFKVVVPGSKQLEDVKLVDQRAPWSKPDPNKVQKIRKKWVKKKKKN